MQSTQLKPLFHRGGEQIGIFFPKNEEINSIVRKIKGIKWSQTHKCWYLPLSKTSYQLIVDALRSKTELDVTLLKAYWIKKKAVQAAVVPGRQHSPNKDLTTSPAWKLSKENLGALQKLIEQLKLKAYSASTVKTYRNEFLQLLQLLKKKPVHELSTDDLRRYFVYCFEKLKLTENTLHSRINSVKFYFEQVLGREKFFWEIPRPKKPILLPKVLNEEEIGKLFRALLNKKHKAMLFAIYSAGLRVSELANLKMKDIDSGRMQIRIEQAKGKKDRYVGLSPVLLDILRSYLKTYNPRPKTFCSNRSRHLQLIQPGPFKRFLRMRKTMRASTKQWGYMYFVTVLQRIYWKREQIFIT